MSTQKDLRRLLSITKQQRQQQQEAASSSPQSSSRITHPFAKYDTNKLICVVCSVTIKNESLWNSHLESLPHKESLRKLREAKEKTSKASSVNTSSSISNRVVPSIKSPTMTTSASTFKPKSILKKESSFDNLERESTTTNSKKRTVGIEGKITISGSNVFSNADAGNDNSIKNLIGYEEDDDDKNESEEEEEEKVSEQARVKRVKYSDDSLITEHIIEPIPQNSALTLDSETSIDEENTLKASVLPSDFFDDTETATSATITINHDTTQVTQQESALPADFFDDDSLNHSSTKVSTTAEIDEQEWINFQKEISKETQVSNQISNADDEQLQRDRDEMQEREQEFCLARLERLKNVAKQVKENRDKHMTVDDSVNEKKVKDDDENVEDTEDEDDDDDFINGWMDWRAQKIL